ncbi:DUF1365 domain-containing protein [Ramlibacter sp. PS3R-8]|uniref:DUF1365 domain-containing protein n=1 Tax=Ramlibacter sp. PS3R-8 TaxID=3133437 RepID=UPI00309743CD
MNSGLYRGHVVHQRLRPRAHRLRYGLFSLLLDLDELDALHGGLRLLSVNRGNVLSFREADHGDGSAPRLRDQVDRWLATAGLQAGGRIRLHTMPRILGYAFNPLSVYFCDRPDGQLQAIVYEVNSTFGERHRYLLAVSTEQAREARAGGQIAQRCAKRMHVSPFIGMEAEYAFRMRPPGDADGGRLSIGVDVHDEGGPLLLATHGARRFPLTDAALLRALLFYPLLTLKVIVAIHWEALLLWRKRVPFVRRPPPAVESLTVAPSDPRP